LEPDTIKLVNNVADTISFYPISIGVIIGLSVIILMLFASALVSGSEVAFFSLSPSDKATFNESKSKSHQLIRNLLNVPEKLLATILIANSFIDVGIVIISTYIVNNIVDFSNAVVLGFIIQTVVITFLILLFGEILPKIYAAIFSLGFAEFMAMPIWISMKILSPLIYLLINSTSIINKRLSKYKTISIDEISQALELTSEEDLSDDKDILEGIVKFGTTCAYQIMTPRIDVVALENSSTPDKIINTINYSGYSRIPVYDETFDNIEGILYIKDLLPHINDLEHYRWQSLLRPPFYVPENKKLDDILKEFQKSKVHMAIVVDEYGGTQGIITLEDILEEIVGDLIDEFDDDDVLYSKVNDNTYIFDGKTQLNDFYRICNLEDNIFEEIKGESDTLAGLLLEIKSDFPKQNEKISHDYIDFIVESLDKRRIKKIKVIFNNPI
jgi:gliding motility-associated protein GldE